MKSMTGYGRGTAQADGRSVVVEISSVNRRNLETQVSLPAEWPGLDREIHERIRADAGRGKVSVQVRPQETDSGGPGWNQQLLHERLRSLRSLVEAEKGVYEVTPELVLQLLQSDPAIAADMEEDDWRKLVQEALHRACADWQNMRAAEGAQLQADLEERAARLCAWLRQIEALASGTVAAYRDKLMERLRQSGLELDLADERVLKEIALFADRCDISEEITRLGSHYDQLEEALGAEGPVGRKLDFICQEIYRELNTIGSKANNLEISRLVIECKNEWERLREQAANAE